MGAAASENSGELDRVVHGYRAERRVCHRPRIRSKAKDRGVLIREHLRERRAVSEIGMQDLVELGMRDPEPPAADRRHALDVRVLERVAKGASADHPGRANDDEALLARRWNVHARPRGVAKSLMEATRCFAVMTMRRSAASPSNRSSAGPL